MSVNSSESGCTLFPDAPEKCTAIVAVKRIVAALSMLGCVFIVFVIFLFKKYQFFVQRLLLYLSLSAFCDSIAYMMGDLSPGDDETSRCVFLAWWMSFFEYSLILWVCCITFNLYFNAIKRVKTEKFEKYYLLVAWGVSLILSCLPFIGDHYGPAGPWCWIAADSSNSTVWRFMVWYVPLFMIIVFLFTIYTYIFIVIRRQVKSWDGTYNVEAEQSKLLMKEDIKPLRFYPFVYLALSIFPFVHRVYNAFNREENFILLLLHVICNPMVGGLNAIVFALDKETLSRLNWVQIKVAFHQHSHTRKPLVREYPVGETNEVRPNDDSSWASSSPSDSPSGPSPTPVPAPPPPIATGGNV